MDRRPLAAVAVIALATAAGAAAILSAGCATSGDEFGDTTSDGAPLVGVDGSRDQADRNCHVVLRELGRSGSGLALETEGSSWVWSGTVEISDEAAAEGLVPSVLYRMAPSGAWSSVVASASGAAATPGYVAYSVRIAQGLPGPGWSGTALSNARIEVVPYLALAEGGRLFDHNRHASDLANYEITGPEWTVWHDPTVCVPPAGPAHATLVFDASFEERREGVLAPGGRVTIVYDTDRLTQCRNSQGGHPRWDITAHVVFTPGGQRNAVTVRDAAPTLEVPPDARGVTLWFENTAIPGCRAWDSNFGANYEFAALVPPQWMGNARSLITRDANDPCDGGAAANQPFAFDDWARQRASVSNLCFEVYEPGLTDTPAATLWQELDAQLHYRYVGATASEWQVRPVNLDRTVGNNARYALDWRSLDPLRSYHCPEVAPRTTDAPDGARAEITLEYYVTVNGGELRPAPGGAYAGVFSGHAPDAWRAANCD